MPAQAADYIKELNELSEELLRSHGDLLGRKEIRRKRDMIQAIKLDLDKLTHALLEVKDTPAATIARNFFGGSDVDPAQICSLAIPRIYHAGFEIHEPLDLVVYGINHWIQRSKSVLGANMSVSRTLRFPASEAFQNRVGAYAEIMRIWLDVNGRELMLELFDIYRPAEAVFAEGGVRLTHRNFHPLFQENETAREHQQRVARLFAGDEIWHYALFVQGPEEVIALQEQLQSLAARNSEYFLPYTAPVHNRHDGSFHTKVVHRAGPSRRRLEIEFVTEIGEAVN